MKFKSFRNWKVSSKIFSIILLSLVPIGIIAFYILPTMRTQMMIDRENIVKNIVEASYYIIKTYNDRAIKGEFSVEEAQRRAAAQLNYLRYSDGKEYIFAHDFNGNAVILGSDPTKTGINRLNLKDVNGFELVKEMIKIAKTEKEGYITYYFPKLGETEALPKISYVKLFEDWGWIIGSGLYVDDVNKEINAFQARIYTPLAILIVLSIIFVVVINRRIGKPIVNMTATLDRIVGGDEKARVPIESEDEIGKLAKAFNEMIDYIQKQMVDIKKQTELAEKAASDATKAQEEVEHQKEYLERHTHIILGEMNKLAGGDLTVHVMPEREDDSIGQLFTGFNQVIENLRSMFGEINQAVHATASSANEISASSEQMATGAREQNQQTTEIAGAVEEMSKTIIESAKNTNHAAEQSKTASDNAKIGAEKVAATKKGMERIVKSTEETGDILGALGDKLQQIGEISQVIDDIADQTNLLALNAAIEAARAGEQGRGFAVVADEVRKLAERTAKATKEIGDTIVSIQGGAQDAVKSMEMAEKAVDEGMLLTEEVAKSLTEVLKVNQSVTDIVVQLAAASEQQSSAAEEISKNVEGISNITQETTMGTEQIARAAEDLNRLTLNLQNLAARFKL